MVLVLFNLTRFCSFSESDRFRSGPSPSNIFSRVFDFVRVIVAIGLFVIHATYINK